MLKSYAPLGAGRAAANWRTFIVMSAQAFNRPKGAGVRTTLLELTRTVHPGIKRIQARDLRGVVDALYVADATWLVSTDKRYATRVFWTVLPSGLVEPRADDVVIFGLSPGVAELDAGAVMIDLGGMLRLESTERGTLAAAAYMKIARAWDAWRHPRKPVVLTLNEFTEWIGGYTDSPEDEPEGERIKRVKRDREASRRLLGDLHDLELVHLIKQGVSKGARFRIKPPPALEEAYRTAKDIQDE